MSDHDEGCDYRHGNEPCNNKLAELECDLVQARERIGQLQREFTSLEINRDHFCHWINEIARLFWGDDKQCYAPDATFRMVERLRAENAKMREFGDEFIWGENNPAKYESELSKLRAERDALEQRLKELDHTYAENVHCEHCGENKVALLAGRCWHCWYKMETDYAALRSVSRVAADGNCAEGRQRDSTI